MKILHVPSLMPDAFTAIRRREACCFAGLAYAPCREEYSTWPQRWNDATTWLFHEKNIVPELFGMLPAGVALRTPHVSETLCRGRAQSYRGGGVRSCEWIIVVCSHMCCNWRGKPQAEAHGGETYVLLRAFFAACGVNTPSLRYQRQSVMSTNDRACAVAGHGRHKRWRWIV